LKKEISPEKTKFIVEKLNHPQVFSQNLETIDLTIDMELVGNKSSKMKRALSSKYQLNQIAKLPNIENDFIQNGFQLGFKNFGNTCYINALIQSLYSIKCLTACFNNFEAINVLNLINERGNRNNLFDLYMALMTDAWQNKDPTTVNTNLREFVNCFLDTFHLRFERQVQQDATEAYFILLDYIDSYFNRIWIMDEYGDERTEKEYENKKDAIIKLSRVLTTKISECQGEGCGFVSMVQDNYLYSFTISLNGLKGANTIEQYIRDQNLYEMLEKECERCSRPSVMVNKTKVVDNKWHKVNQYIKKLPDYLYCILTLFDLDVSFLVSKDFYNKKN